MNFEGRRQGLRRRGWPKELADRLHGRVLLAVESLAVHDQDTRMTPTAIAEILGDGDPTSFDTLTALSHGPKDADARVGFANLLGLRVQQVELSLGWKPIPLVG